MNKFFKSMKIVGGWGVCGSGFNRNADVCLAAWNKLMIFFPFYHIFACNLCLANPHAQRTRPTTGSHTTQMHQWWTYWINSELQLRKWIRFGFGWCGNLHRSVHQWYISRQCGRPWWTFATRRSNFASMFNVHVLIQVISAMWWSNNWEHKPIYGIFLRAIFP